MLGNCTLGALRLEFENANALSAPRLIHAPSGEILVDYWGTGWFGTASLDQRGRVRLWIRRDKKDILGHVVVVDQTRGTITRDYGQGRVAVQRPACLARAEALAA